MKKINFNSFLKSKNIFFVFISLLVFSLIGGVIFAQNSNPPSASTNVTVTPSPCTSSTPHITITWPTVPVPTGVTANIMYKVFRNADTDALVSSLTSPYYIDNSITTQTQYSYMVKAYYTDNGTEVSSALSPVSQTVYVPASCNNYSTIPTVPTNVTASPSSCSATTPHININWSTVPQPTGVTDSIMYKVFRNADTDALVSSLTSPYYIDNSITTQTQYSYMVKAYYTDNGTEVSSALSPVSSTVSVPVLCNVPPPGVIPSAPTKLLLNSISTPHFVSIYWIDNSSNEDKFNIQRKFSSATQWFTIGQVGTNITNFIDSSSLSGISYDYRIQSCLSGIGCSDYAYLTEVKIEPVFNNTTTTPPPTNQPSPTNQQSPTSQPFPTTNQQLPLPTTQYTQPTTTQHVPTTQNKKSITQQAPITNQQSPTSQPFQRANQQFPSPTTNQPTLIPNTTPATEQINQTESSDNIPQATPQEIVVSETAPPTVFSSQVQDLGLAVEGFKNSVDSSKEQLVRTINENVANIVNNNDISGQENDVAKINILRDQLLEKIDLRLSSSTTITTSDINNLNSEINKGINNIKLAAGENIATTQANNASVDITKTLSTLSETVNNQSEVLKANGGDLLYKDSNKDGISDYDSVYVYNLNPVKPSPVSTYNGKNITASEKVLLGLDPTKTEIVKVEKEQPIEAKAPVVATYKVEKVSLTEKKEIIFKGKALPNSFITVYIYSTPVMVTVKTDSNGEWVYVLDKELENGDHTVYTATVNNSGNIIAKSTGFLFTKTAEAATLKDISATGASVSVEKPGLFEGNSIYIILIIVFAAILIILILVGLTSKRNREKIEREESERHVLH